MESETRENAMRKEERREKPVAENKEELLKGYQKNTLHISIAQ